MTTTISADGFLGELGANTHIAYTDGEYANVSLILSDLQYLGIDQVRDGISDGSGGSAPLSSYITLAKAGIHFTFLVEASTTADLTSSLNLFAEVEAAVPGSITAIEGPNEINNQPITYNGVSGLQGALNLQAALYTAVHSDAALAGVAVDYFTGYDTVGYANGPDPVATGIADDDNQHPYPKYGEPPASWVARSATFPNSTNPNEPAVFTEAGYSTVNVDPTVQAKYTLDLLMDASEEGISKTYLYQLLDAYAPGSVQGDSGYGLFDYTEAAKPVATALHNLTSVLHDGGANALSFQTTPLNYTISGLPSSGNSMALEESSGAYFIVVWAEPEIWNNTTSTEIAAPSETVTVSLPTAYASVQVFDPLVGTSAIATYANQSSVTVAVTDHPILVEVSQSASGGVVNGAPGETLYGETNGTLVATTGAETLIGAAGASLFELAASSAFVESQGADTIVGSSASATIDATGAPIFFGSTGTAVFNAEGGAATVIGGSGSETVNAGSAAVIDFNNGDGPLVFNAGSGASTLVGGGSETIQGAAAPVLDFAGSGSFSFSGGSGIDTVAGSGVETIGSGSSNLVFFGGSGATSFTAGSGADTVVGGTGGMTVNGGSSALVLFGEGPTVYNPGTAVDTVVGSKGPLTATGGVNGGVFFTGGFGMSQVNTGSGSSTITGGGVGDLFTVTGAGDDVIALLGASETIAGASGSGNSTYFAFGADEVIGSGSGNTAIDTFSGDDTLIGGSGSTLFELTAGSASRTVTINNFNAATDVIQLQGFGASASSTALQTATVANGAETLSLSDGSKITFMGVTHLSASSFI